MPNYETSGNLYSFDEGDIRQLFLQHHQFLAWTDVNIVDTRNNNSVHADFIAINWNNISALLKEENWQGCQYATRKQVYLMS